MAKGNIALVTALATLLATAAYNHLNTNQMDNVPDHIVEAFNTWTSKHMKLYSSPEEQYFRLKAFHKNYNTVKAHNERNLSSKFALNKFADLTPKEFAAKYLQAPTPQKDFVMKNSLESPFEEDNKEVLTQQVDKVDWTARGCNTGIYAQGNCAAGYAIAAANAVTYASIAKRYRMTLQGSLQQQPMTQQASAQEIIDCSSSYGDNGCSGGTANNAFDYVYYNGLSYESVYGYTGYESGRCRGQSPTQNKISNHYKVSRDNNGRLKAAVKQQPVTAAVDATTWQFYSSGVFHGSGCSESSISHFVTIVGYGYEDGQNFWKIENSWGSNWGSFGYVKLYRSTGSSSYPCGISSNVFYPYFR